MGLAALAVAAWLLLPQPAAGAPDRPGVRVVVLDASASAARTRRGLAGIYLARVEEQARAARDAGQELAVVRLAPEVRRLVGPCSPESWTQELDGPWRPLVSAGQDGGSPLDLAVQSAAALLLEPGREPGELVLCTDGAWTGPDPRARLAALVQAGCRVVRIPLPEPNLDDGGVVDLAGPRFSAAGEPVVLRLDWRGSAAAAHRVELRLRQTGAPQILRRDLGPGPGSAGLTRTPLDLGPLPEGLYSIEARLLVGAGDRTPEDDSARILHRVGAAPLVGMVARGGEQQLYRSPWTRGAPRGLAFDWCAPEQVLERLPHWDALVTWDLGPAALPGPVLRDFVREGGGWLAMGGVGLLDGWASTATGRLLPLQPEDADRDPRDVILLVDGSGSMNEREPGRVSRWDRVRAAVQGLVQLVPAQDGVQVWFFTHDLVQPPAFLGNGGSGQGAEVERLMTSRAPGGVTNILDSMHTLIELRAGARRSGDQRQALVLLLSDGYQTNSSSHSASELRADLEASGGELRVLSIGVRPRLGLLSAFLRSGEAVVPAGDLDDLERILVDEVFRDGVRRDPGMALHPVDEALLEADGPAAAVRRAMTTTDGLPAAPVGAYLRARVQPDADVLLTGLDSDPVLALRGEGLGRVAALATLPAAPWCAGLSANPRLLGPLLRLLAAPAAGARRIAGPRATLVDGELRVSGLDASLPAELSASVRGGAGVSPGSVAMYPDPHAADPRRARLGRWPWPPPGGGPQLALTAQEREWLVLPLEVSPGPEWTATADGLPASWPEPRAEGAVWAPQAHPAAPWLLGFGLLCMALAAWIRVGPPESHPA